MMTTTASTSKKITPSTPLDLILEQIDENNRQTIFGQKTFGMPATNGFKKMMATQFKATALANTETSDQTALWQLFLKAIAGQVAEEPNNLIAAGSGIPTDFADLGAGVAVAQLYALGNTIPPWSLKWNGATNDNLFSTYQQFVNIIHPNALDPDSDQGKQVWSEMQEILTKIQTFQTGLSSLRKEMYSAWLAQVCLELDANDSNKCSINGYFPSDTYPNGDKPDPSFSSWYASNKDSGEWGEKAQALTVDGSITYLGLQSDYAKLAQQYFGDGYQTIAEAQQSVAWADPLGLAISKTSPPDNIKNSLQMSIKEGSAAVSVPSFTWVTDPEDFRNWLTQQQAIAANNNGPLTGDKATVQVKFDNTSINKTESDWKFHAQLGVPIDWFWLGEDASGSQQNQFEEKYSFNGLITYQAITKVTFQPGDWFNQSLLQTYANFDLSTLQSGDPFYDQQLWGPNGILNVLIKGVVIGYGAYMRFQMDDWQNSTTKTQWSTKTTFGIGPFNFESADASGSNYSSQTNELQDGLEVIDTSGQPKIIALIVETPNYSPVS